MTAQHTPGPWSLPHIAQRLDVEEKVSFGVIGAPVTLSGPYWEVMPAARLIATAPELLALAEELVAWEAADCSADGADNTDWEGLNAIFAKAVSLVVKAKST